MPSTDPKARWLKNHLGADRSRLRVILPSSVVLNAQREAARLGLSLTAYLCTALDLAPEMSDRILDHARVLEHVHGVAFRRARVPSSDTPVPPADNAEGTP